MDLISIPIFNQKISLFKGPPIILSNNCSIEKISDGEHSALFRGASEEICQSLDLKSTRCIKIRLNDPDVNTIKHYRTKSVFLLNIFSDSHGVVTSWAAQLSGEEILSLKKIVEFESLAGFLKISSKTFRILPTTQRATIIQFFKVIDISTSANPTIIFTLEKYNSSLLRDDFLDKLLDSTICFESMMPGNTELVYRMSQNIAFIVGTNAEERLEIFDNMKTLYEVRSKLVHGDVNEKMKNKIEMVENNWNSYEKYMKAAVSYYLLFLSENKKDLWETHLKELILGTQNKLA